MPREGTRAHLAGINRGGGPSPGSRPQTPQRPLPPHPSPSLCLRLLVEGSFLLLGVGGGTESPHTARRSSVQSLGEVIPGREFPPLLESRTSSITKAVTLRLPPWPAGTLRAIPGTASSSTTPAPLPTLPGAPHQGASMHAPSLWTNIGGLDPVASSREAPTPEPAKPRLHKGGAGG